MVDLYYVDGQKDAGAGRPNEQLRLRAILPVKPSNHGRRACRTHNTLHSRSTAGATHGTQHILRLDEYRIRDPVYRCQCSSGSGQDQNEPLVWNTAEKIL